MEVVQKGKDQPVVASLLLIFIWKQRQSGLRVGSIYFSSNYNSQPSIKHWQILYIWLISNISANLSHRSKEDKRVNTNGSQTPKTTLGCEGAKNSDTFTQFCACLTVIINN